MNQHENANKINKMECMYSCIWKILKFKNKKNNKLYKKTIKTPICVTGIDSFLGSWIVHELVEKGYKVRGIIQSRNDNIIKLCELLNKNNNLTIMEASLLTPDSCDIAIQGCEYVIHTGTPSSCSVRDPISEQEDPGVHSIGSRLHCIIPMMTNFIQSCIRLKVKKIVLTSSIAAMVDTITNHTMVNESSWNYESSLDKNPYFLSLKIAEETAWQLMDQIPFDRNKIKGRFVTINPGTLFGPVLYNSKIPPGNQVIHDLLTGQYSALVDLNWAMVDVRDCANCHILAIENSEAHGRYVCVNKTIWLKDIVDILTKEGFGGRGLPWKVGLPNWVARLPSYSAQLGQVGASLYPPKTLTEDDNSIKSYEKSLNFDNTKTLNVLGLCSFISVEETVKDVGNDLLKWGLIKPWAEDKEITECMICNFPFTFYRRKHHCRECGIVICGDCSRSRAAVEGMEEEKARLCDKCVRSSIPALLNLLEDSENNDNNEEKGIESRQEDKRKAVKAIESLLHNPANHEFITRNSGITLLLKMLEKTNDSLTKEHIAGALHQLTLTTTSSLQLILEGGVLQMLEFNPQNDVLSLNERNDKLWKIMLHGLRNLWKQINKNDFKQMLLAVARVSYVQHLGKDIDNQNIENSSFIRDMDISFSPLKANILLTFVHMMEKNDVVYLLLEEDLLLVLYKMLTANQIHARTIAANTIKHSLDNNCTTNILNEDVEDILIPPFVVDDHEELLINSSLCDIQFLVKGNINPINAHKVVLFLRNPYFKNMFGSTSSLMTTIKIDNCSHEVFYMLLRFLYCGRVDLNMSTAEGLLKASCFYQMHELQKRVERYLSNHMTIENVIDLLYLSNSCYAIDLKKKSLFYLIKHLYQVVKLNNYNKHKNWASIEILDLLTQLSGKEWETYFIILKQKLKINKFDIINKKKDRNKSKISYQNDTNNKKKENHMNHIHSKDNNIIENESTLSENVIENKNYNNSSHQIKIKKKLVETIFWNNNDTNNNIKNHSLKNQKKSDSLDELSEGIC